MSFTESLVAASTVQWLIEHVTMKSAPMMNAAAAACGVPMPPAAPTRIRFRYPYRAIASSLRPSVTGNKAAATP